jgi:L-asparaginase
MSTTIVVLATGGTIDKAYPRTMQGYAFEIDSPAVSRILEDVVLHPRCKVVVEQVLKKDSTVRLLEM